MIHGLHHIAILCADRGSTAFYSALGFREVKAVTRPERQDEIIWMEGHGITLELFISRGNPPRPSYPEAYGLRHLALRVTEIEAIAAALAAAGYSPEPIRRDTVTGEKMTFVADPDGLPIELHE